MTAPTGTGAPCPTCAGELVTELAGAPHNRWRWRCSAVTAPFWHSEVDGAAGPSRETEEQRAEVVADELATATANAPMRALENAVLDLSRRAGVELPTGATPAPIRAELQAAIELVIEAGGDLPTVLHWALLRAFGKARGVPPAPPPAPWPDQRDEMVSLAALDAPSTPEIAPWSAAAVPFADAIDAGFMTEVVGTRERRSTSGEVQQHDEFRVTCCICGELVADRTIAVKSFMRGHRLSCLPPAAEPLL